MKVLINNAMGWSQGVWDRHLGPSFREALLTDPQLIALVEAEDFDSEATLTLEQLEEINIGTLNIASRFDYAEVEDFPYYIEYQDGPSLQEELAGSVPFYKRLVTLLQEHGYVGRIPELRLGGFKVLEPTEPYVVRFDHHGAGERILYQSDFAWRNP